MLHHDPLLRLVEELFPSTASRRDINLKATNGILQHRQDESLLRLEVDLSAKVLEVLSGHQRVRFKQRADFLRHRSDRRKVTLYLPVQRTAMSVDRKLRTKGRLYNYASFWLSDGFFARLRSLTARDDCVGCVPRLAETRPSTLSSAQFPRRDFYTACSRGARSQGQLHVLGSATETAEIALMITPQQTVTASSTEVL